MHQQNAKLPADRQAFIDAVAGVAAEVYEFHRRWGQSVDDPHTVIRERLGLLQEEVDELRSEVGPEGSGADSTAIIDEAADVLFVAIGNLERLGQAGLDGMVRVTHKNAAKTADTHYVRGHDGKITRRPRGR